MGDGQVKTGEMEKIQNGHRNFPLGITKTENCLLYTSGFHLFQRIGHTGRDGIADSDNIRIGVKVTKLVGI